MLKWLTVIGSAFLVVAVVLVARYDKFHDTEGKGYDIKCTQSSEPSATMGSLVCTAEHSQKAKSGQYDPLWWHIFFAWPEGITALLLMLTLGAITWQAWETRKAAKAAKDSVKATLESVKLQEAQLRQWVETSDTWEVGHARHNLIGRTETTVSIEFGITNPTAWPLNLIKITTCAGSTGRPRPERPSYELRPNEAYPMRLEYLITGDELGRYRGSTLDVNVTILVLFRDVLGRARFQPFYLTCKDCRPSNLRCTVYPRQRPRRQKRPKAN